MYKCLDCGYIGVTFIEVEEKRSPSTEENLVSEWRRQLTG